MRLLKKDLLIFDVWEISSKNSSLNICGDVIPIPGYVLLDSELYLVDEFVKTVNFFWTLLIGRASII